MTNGDWIRSLTDEELEKNIIHPCHNFLCGKCQLANERGKCVLGQSKTIAFEWLESEHEDRALGATGKAEWREHFESRFSKIE